MLVEIPCMFNPTLKDHANCNIIQQDKADMCKALGIYYRNRAKHNIFH